MAYDVTIEGSRNAGNSGSAKLTLIAALATALVVFSLVDVSGPSTPQVERGVETIEDWHGNVRRSNWPN